MAKDGQNERFEPGLIIHQTGTSCGNIRAGALLRQKERSERAVYGTVEDGRCRCFHGVCEMSELNLLEAFWRYRVKPSTRARSAVTDDRALVLSCSYGRFHRAESGIMKYEEDLSAQTGPAATLLRTHLADALTNELDIRLIVAVPVQHAPSLETPPVAARPARTSFHARKDLVGRVTFFDGQRFVVEFRKAA
jgi:hypothetical protein